MTQSAKFWDKIGDRYSKQPIANEATDRKKLEITRGYCRPNMELLEFDCGTGGTALIHAPHVKYIRTFDISSNMLAIAQSKADAQNITNVRFEQNTIKALTAPNATYGMILGLSILHRLEDKAAVLAKIHKMLKPGGYFVSSTTCLGDAMGWFKFIAPIGKTLGLFPIAKIFTTAELEQSLTAAHFDIDCK